MNEKHSAISLLGGAPAGVVGERVEFTCNRRHRLPWACSCCRFRGSN